MRRFTLLLPLVLPIYTALAFVVEGCLSRPHPPSLDIPLQLFVIPLFVVFRPLYPLMRPMGMLEGEWFTAPTPIGALFGSLVYVILLYLFIVGVRFFNKRHQ
jgi:hypothetical protein